MGMTITEKIIAAHAGKAQVQPGEIVNVNVDKVFTHDIFFTGVSEKFFALGSRVWDPDKIILVIDHDLPSTSEFSGTIYQNMAQFAREQGIKNFYYGEGVCHQIIPGLGHVKAGDLFVGTDSHTVTYGALGAFSTGVGSTDMASVWTSGQTWLKVPETIKFVINGKLNKGVYSKDLILYIIGMMRSEGATYKAVEFSGEAISALSMEARFTLSNMSVEMGAKNGIIPFDEKTEAYLNARGVTGYKDYQNDGDARYEQVITIDAAQLRPQVSGPLGVDDVKAIDAIEGLAIHQGYIGSCTNGRIEDLRIAAEILKGKKLAPYVKLIVSPASRNIYKQAIKEGLIDIFIDVGAVVTNAGCTLCYGKHGGVLGAGEVAICSNNRNFPGRLGHKDASVYLASPAMVAASVIEGKITDPTKYIGDE